MSGFRSFYRQLGFQPGIQLNPLRDATDGVAPDNSDQVIGAIARLTRGRIDRPFRVNKSNLIARTGPAEALRVNGLNETKLQIYDALYAGAYEAVVQRLCPAAALKSYAVINFSGSPVGSAETVEFSTATAAPTTGYSIYLMHNNCFNDGIKLALHADQTPLTGAQVAASDVKLRVLDVNGTILHEFEGSLNPAAKDSFGRSTYLPDVAAMQGDDVEIFVASGATIPVTSNAYGRSLSGSENWATSATLVCFQEGGTTYTNDDYDRAITAMRETRSAYGYLISGGSKNVSFLTKLGALAIELNMPCEIDIDGALSPAAALAFAAQLNFDSHYIRYHWAPLKAEDPMNAGSVMWGVGGLHAGLSCARNARVNAKGFAPKNYPIAGKEWPITRGGMRQVYSPTEQELSDLAKGQINPAIFDTFNGGGRFVFTDSLTSAKSLVSYKKLQSVAEMAGTLDNWVTLAAKENLQLPKAEFVRRMDRVMDTLLQGAQASEWLVPSQNLPGGAAYTYSIKPSQVRPADTMVIEYFTSFDGVVRQGFVTQTLSK